MLLVLRQLLGLLSRPIFVTKFPVGLFLQFVIFFSLGKWCFLALGHVAHFKIPTGISEDQLPICIESILDVHEYDFKKWNKISYNNLKLISKEPSQRSCRLVNYTVDRTVRCFDVLYQEFVSQNGLFLTNNTSKAEILHFVFVGDSRIRQQFYNFLKLIPDYDRQTNPMHVKRNEQLFNHGDVDWCSNILRLRVSFRWRPIINDSVIEMMRQWTIAHQVQRPQFIFLSLEIHHMLTVNGNNHFLYQNKLKEFGSILQYLAYTCQIIWLKQYPLVEFYGPTDAHNTDIHSAKINQYNMISQQILKNYSGIQVWDSSNSLAEEYVRSCTIFSEREMQHPIFLTVEKPFNPLACKPYVSCLDFVHTGNAALFQATQILYNAICNAKMFLNKRNGSL